jgi:hypothetical protein
MLPRFSRDQAAFALVLAVAVIAVIALRRCIAI